ncbi:hypothetical protein [Algoriphagus namhaensis]
MKNILTSCLYFIALAILPLGLQAQTAALDESLWSNIDPTTGKSSDFYVTNTGVKVFGELISKYDQATYKTVTFRVSGVENTFEPSELKAFGLANARFFMSKQLPGEESLRFVQVLFSGVLQLNFVDNKYFLDNGERLQELTAFYTQGQIEGNRLKRYVRAYLAVLKAEMAGECGQKLNDRIEETKMEEEAFIRLFKAYHECLGEPYVVHVSNVKYMQVSPFVSYGLGNVILSDRSVEEGQQNSLSKTLSHRFQAGIRLNEFRKYPRISIDFRVGLEILNTTWISEFESPEVVRIEASERYTETNIFIPFSFNYSVYRQGKTDIYAGVVPSIWFSSISSEGGQIREELAGGKVNLYDREILDGVQRLFVPGVKVGARIPVGKVILSPELQGDLLLDYYTTNVLAKRSSFNRPTVSFQIGIEF